MLCPEPFLHQKIVWVHVVLKAVGGGQVFRFVSCPCGALVGQRTGLWALLEEPGGPDLRTRLSGAQPFPSLDRAGFGDRSVRRLETAESLICSQHSSSALHSPERRQDAFVTADSELPFNTFQSR